MSVLQTYNNDTEVYTLVVSRLGGLGYTVSTEAEIAAVNWNINLAEKMIENYCNISSIPDGLMLTWVDMSCGKFLADRMALGDSKVAKDAGLKSVSLGDTSVTFSDEDSGEDKLKKLIDSLMNHEGDLVCYRRLKF